MVFGSLTVFPLTFAAIHLDPRVQLHAHARARNGVIFRKDSGFYASLALFFALCVLCMGPRWGVNVRKRSKKKNHAES